MQPLTDRSSRSRKGLPPGVSPAHVHDARRRRATRKSRWRIVRRVILTAAVVACAAGLALAARSGASARQTLAALDRQVAAAGLGVDQVAITGFSHALPDDLVSALKLDVPASLLSYDTRTAQARLEQLAWVKSARVVRVLPNMLDVSVVERQPSAVWQHRQMLFLIDAEGRTLEPAVRSEHAELPLLVGEGADSTAADLLLLLQRYPLVGHRLEAAVRVGGRRWNLRLRDGPELMLPEDGVEAALAFVEKAEHEDRLLARRIASVDLRVASRVTFRLSAPAPGATPAAVPGRGA